MGVKYHANPSARITETCQNPPMRTKSNLPVSVFHKVPLQVHSPLAPSATTAICQTHHSVAATGPLHLLFSLPTVLFPADLHILPPSGFSSEVTVLYFLRTSIPTWCVFFGALQDSLPSGCGWLLLCDPV